MEGTPHRGSKRAPLAGLALAIPIGLGTGIHAVATGAADAHPVVASTFAAPPPWHRMTTTEPATSVATLPRTPAAGPIRAVGRVGHDNRLADMGHQPPAGQCSESVVTATLMPFSEHMNHAHFQRSPQQQASDVKDVNTYTNTHIALFEAMAGGADGALSNVPTDSLTPFVEHMKYAHIQRQPQQQVADAQQTDDYVKLHTVLLEHMTQPGRTAVIGDC
jgi:hypothetical protein